MESSLRRAGRVLHSRYTHGRPQLLIQRRYDFSTKVKPVQNSSPSHDLSKPPLQIRLPGPNWLWSPLYPLSYPFAAYSRATKSRPYLTQFISSLVIFFLGDISSQYLQRSIPAHSFEKPPFSTTTDVSAPSPADSVPTSSRYDPQRSIRALIIGGTVSIPTYHWFIYLSNLFPQLPHRRSLWMKVIVNQIVYAPIFSAYFFTIHSLLSGHGGDTIGSRFSAAWVRVKTTVPTSWVNGLLFWPITTALSLSFIPLRSRSIFAGGASIIWQSYLSFINQRAVVKELGGGRR